MRMKILGSLGAMLLFLAYFGPMVVKLKEIPLTIVVVGGAILAAIDIWQTLSSSNH